MKTTISILSGVALLSLAACARHDDAANATGEQATANFEEFGNDTGFASDNVILPADNATGLNATEVDGETTTNTD